MGGQFVKALDLLQGILSLHLLCCLAAALRHYRAPQLCSVKGPAEVPNDQDLDAIIYL